MLCIAILRLWAQHYYWYITTVPSIALTDINQSSCTDRHLTASWVVFQFRISFSLQLRMPTGG